MATIVYCKSDTIMVCMYTFQNILSKIINNNKIIKRIEEIERIITEKETTKGDDGKDVMKRESGRLSNESEKFMDEINKLRVEIKMV